MINTSGGSWFNNSWEPQLTSPADEAATNFYVNLVRKDGEAAPPTTASPNARPYGSGEFAAREKGHMRSSAAFFGKFGMRFDRETGG